MLTVTLTLLLVALYLFYYFCIKPLNYWKEKGVKHTYPVWFFGDMLKNSLRIEAFHDAIDERYYKFRNERYFGLYQYTRPILVLRDPDLIKQITVKDFDHFVDHRALLTEQVDPLWTNNLFALKGQRWRNMRPILSPSFTSSKMRTMFVLMNDSAEKFVDFFLKKQQPIIEVDCKDIFTRFCNDVIASAAFGIETNSLEQPNNEFYLMGKEATNFNSLLSSLKIMFMMLSPAICDLLNIRFFSNRVRSFFYDLVDETIRVRQEKNIRRPDMIHLLMQARDGKMKYETESNAIEAGFSAVQEVHSGKLGPIKITNKEIASQAMVFFFGGFDSVSTLMCFVCLELALNPDIQEKMRNEIKETLTECNGKLTYEALLKMKYLDMIVSETLRKWPNATFMDRECTKPYTIQPVGPQENPVELDRGDILWVPVYSIHHDEKYYPNPDQFDPERFNDENKRNIDPNTYLPFGAGPRNCIGSRFALLENKAVLFHLLNNFEVILISKSPVPIKLTKNPFQLMPEKGFWFGLKKLSI